MKYLVHHGGGEEVVETELSEFLLRLPYFISGKNKFIPPDSIINELLAVGRYDVGMSGLFTWDPVSISSVNIEEANRKLLSVGYVKPNVPDWVIDSDAWNAWKLEKLNGVPPDKYLRLLRNVKEIKSEMAAQPYMDSDAKSLIETRLIEAEFELSNFLNEYFD